MEIGYLYMYICYMIKAASQNLWGAEELLSKCVRITNHMEVNKIRSLPHTPG